MTDQPRIAVTTSSFAKFSQEPMRLMTAAGYAPVLNPHGRKLTEDEAIEVLSGCVGVVAGTEPLTRRVLTALSGLKAIARCGTGMDNVDQEAARELGMAVTNTPDGPTLAVVELTLGLALDLVRDVTRMDRELRSGIWKKRMGRTLQGKRLGVVGFGRIGRAVARAFAPLGVDIAYFDPFVDGLDTPKKSLDELLVWADILTLHCSKPKEGGHLIGDRELRLMPRGSWLINCARGGLVDETALHAALAEGRLAGAALDVFEAEPYVGPLKDLDSVILTPHIGSYAMESRITMEVDAVKNLLASLGKG